MNAGWKRTYVGTNGALIEDKRPYAEFACKKPTKDMQECTPGTNAAADQKIGIASYNKIAAIEWYA